MSIHGHTCTRLHYGSKQLEIITASQLSMSTRLKFKDLSYSTSTDTKQGVLTKNQDVLTKNGNRYMKSFSQKILSARHKEMQLVIGSLAPFGIYHNTACIYSTCEAILLYSSSLQHVFPVHHV